MDFLANFTINNNQSKNETTNDTINAFDANFYALDSNELVDISKDR